MLQPAGQLADLWAGRPVGQVATWPVTASHGLASLGDTSLPSLTFSASLSSHYPSHVNKLETPFLLELLISKIFLQSASAAYCLVTVTTVCPGDKTEPD